MSLLLQAYLGIVNSFFKTQKYKRDIMIPIKNQTINSSRYFWDSEKLDMFDLRIYNVYFK